jgi:hypothetical protein
MAISPYMASILDNRTHLAHHSGDLSLFGSFRNMPHFPHALELSPGGFDDRKREENRH